jgi:hypothetical protein
MIKLNEEKIRAKLPIGLCIHKTKKGNCFLISHYRVGRIFFSIPNNNDKNKPYKKSISIQLIIQFFETINYDFSTFPYKDCRKSAAKGILTILEYK